MVAHGLGVPFCAEGEVGSGPGGIPQRIGHQARGAKVVAVNEISVIVQRTPTAKRAETTANSLGATFLLFALDSDFGEHLINDRKVKELTILPKRDT